MPLPSGASFASAMVWPALAAPSSILPCQPGTLMPPPAMERPVSSDAGFAAAGGWASTAEAANVRARQQARRLAMRMGMISGEEIVVSGIIAGQGMVWLGQNW